LGVFPIIFILLPELFFELRIGFVFGSLTQLSGDDIVILFTIAAAPAVFRARTLAFGAITGSDRIIDVTRLCFRVALFARSRRDSMSV
jgi:hypothetical protein